MYDYGVWHSNGCHFCDENNFCACIVKITAIPYETEIPAIMHGFPGTSWVYFELVYAIIEILLAICAFYMGWTINKRETMNYLDPQYHYTIPDYEAIHSNLNLI